MSADVSSREERGREGIRCTLQSQRSSSLETGKARIKLGKRTKQVKPPLDTPLKLEQSLGAVPSIHLLASHILPVGVSIAAQSCEQRSGSRMTVLLLPWRGAEASFQQSCSLDPFSAVQAKEADDLQAVLRYNLALQVRLLIILCKAGPDTQQGRPCRHDGHPLQVA